MKNIKKCCPRCSKGFECRVDSISQCQCSAIKLTETDRAFISGTFEDCLCVDCLKEIKADKDNFKLPR